MLQKLCDSFVKMILVKSSNLFSGMLFTISALFWLTFTNCSHFLCLKIGIKSGISICISRKFTFQRFRHILRNFVRFLNLIFLTVFINFFNNFCFSMNFPSDSLFFVIFENVLSILRMFILKNCTKIGFQKSPVFY